MLCLIYTECTLVSKLGSHDPSASFNSLGWNVIGLHGRTDNLASGQLSSLAGSEAPVWTLVFS